jgi:hypothetical protein
VFVGHYGCTGRLVKVRQRQAHLDAGASVPARRGKPPRSARPHCPACGYRHLVEIIWREAREGELAQAEISV